jgi:DNA-binding CsgD family transcriptional regulator
VLRGEAGIGKTTLWEAGIALAEERGLRVLVVRPCETEAKLSFAGLIDLCERVELESLPAPQREALEVALLRRAPTGAPPEPHAIGLALRSALAAAAPVLVAIDDVQWLDALSAEVLAFAARRLVDAPVGFLVAHRTGEPSPLESALARRSLSVIDVGPLTAGELRGVVAERLGVELAVPTLQRITAATLGNPLFALEITRGLGQEGDELPVPAAVEELLGVRVAALPDADRWLLLAVAFGADLDLDALEAIGDGVREALQSGLLTADGDRVRAGHPLLAAVARATALPSERRAVHAVLAEVVPEPERRALHLALATEEPDEVLAAYLSLTAERAAARGARPEAVALGEQALRLTAPNEDTRAERVLALAGYLESAGERRRVRDLLAPLLGELPPGEPQVRAWLFLSESGVETRSEHAAHIERALEAAGGDLELRRRVLALKALSTAAEGVERIPEAIVWGLESLPEPDALRALGWARALRGLEIEGVCDQFEATVGPGAHLIDSPAPLMALRRSWRGEVGPAREETTQFLELAAERGEGVGYAWLRLNLTEIELRAGEWDAAEQLLDEWEASDEGELLITPTYQRCRALLAAGRGDPEAARRWATPALEEAERRGYTWQILESHRALGAAALLAHDPEQAAGHLRLVYAHCQREGIEEQGAFPVAADLLEALGELGADDEAAAVRARLAALAHDQFPGDVTDGEASVHDHPWAVATLLRANGEAAAAAAAYDTLGLRFDAARTHLAHGRAARRARQWRVAREALETAAAAFDALGSPGWAEQARAELSRVGGRKPRTDAHELTQTERQVARLAASGQTNKEIASALFVTTHTVEAHLSKVYAKLGVRSRTELAAQL